MQIQTPPLSHLCQTVKWMRKDSEYFIQKVDVPQTYLSKIGIRDFCCIYRPLYVTALFVKEDYALIFRLAVSVFRFSIDF